MSDLDSVFHPQIVRRPAWRKTLPSHWLFVPGAFLGLLLLVLGSWGVSNAIRGRRVARRYAESLGYRSNTKPS